MTVEKARSLNLPIQTFLPEIVDRLRTEGVFVLTAEPGAGKTSLVPLAISEAFGKDGKVILAEPRRVAAIGAATRLAELTSLSLGDEVGYRVKGESRAGPATRIEAVTAGVLVRMLQSDPFLEGVAALVFDEFHERSLDLDLALALAREARAAREGGLRILVMSATLDIEGLSSCLGASVLRVPGRIFPIETRHARSSPSDPLRWTAEAILESAAGGRSRGRGAGADPDGGDILVFLPGMAEILRVEGLISARLAEFGIETLRLHSSLPLAEQRRAISGASTTGPKGLPAPRRVILSTSIAETSLTLPGVRTVIDCGLARGIRFDRRSGLNRLVTERESADRAEQRRGRAGRLGPGLCLRAWPSTEILPERSPPEILRADLSDLVLECLVWGAGSPTELRWIDAPPKASWDEALATLRGLGAVASEAESWNKATLPPRVTRRGREMASLGVEVRLAALVIEGRDAERGRRGSGSTACLAASILDRGGPSEMDFADRVVMMARGRPDDRDPGSAAVLGDARRLASRAGIEFDCGRVDAELLPRLLAAAWPDRVARRVEYGGSSAIFMLGAGRRIKAGQALAASAWIVALDADAGESLGRLYAGIAIDEDLALAALAPLVVEEELIEWKGRGYRARRSRRAGSLVLSSTALGALDRPRLAAALRERIGSEGLASLFPDAEAEDLLARYRFWRSRPGNEGVPELLGAEAVSTIDEWLLPWIDTDPANILPGTRLRQALEDRLPREILRRFRDEAPLLIELPSGAVRPLIYDQGPLPLVEGRIHEFFGLREHPRACGLPLVVRLLSPAGRPIQVTADLPGFWKGGWAEARKELRGRYPKHDWPEDPAAAPPSRKGLKPRQA